MSRVFVVMGQSGGSREDSEEWPVVAFLEESQARRYKKNAAREQERVSVKFRAAIDAANLDDDKPFPDGGARRFRNVFDVKRKYPDPQGTSFYVMAVRLGRTP